MNVISHILVVITTELHKVNNEKKLLIFISHYRLYDVFSVYKTAHTIMSIGCTQIQFHEYLYCQSIYF